MLGEPCISDLKPLTKNSELTAMTTSARSSWSNPFPTQLSSKKRGCGQSHSITPMETYTRGRRKISETASLRARSLWRGSADWPADAGAPFGDA